MSEVWKELFSLAVRFLENSGLSTEKWVMGGGTVLMLHYRHRLSKDIDIFINDPQLLTLLTPRLNDFVAEYISDYDEQSNFLKLRFREGEIDYIVAPNLTGLEPIIMDIENIPVRTDAPEEIVIKKIFYRTETLKVRDIIDIATVIKNRADSLRQFMPICSKKLNILRSRIENIRPNYKKNLMLLEIIDMELAESALQIFEDFLIRLNPQKLIRVNQ